MKIRKFNESQIIDETGEMVNKETEENFANNYKLCKDVITITHYDINMVDEFNSDIYIHLSNGDVIHYSCDELKKPKKPGDAPPYYEVEVTINGKFVSGDDFLDEYGGGLCWLKSLMDFYENYTKNE